MFMYPVTLAPDKKRGGFVVTFYNDNVGPDGTSDNVYLREYDAAGNAVDGMIAVQVHGGNQIWKEGGMHRFRNIAVRELP